MPASYHSPASFPPQTPDQRAALLDWVASTPLVYGPWQEFKRGFKTLESGFASDANEPELLGAMLARLDGQEFPEHFKAKTGNNRPAPLLADRIFSLIMGEGVVYASTQMGLRVFEASSPLEPKPLPQSTSKITYSYGLTRVGRFLLEADGSLYDLEDPRAPRFVTRGELVGGTIRAVDDKHLLAFDNWQGLRVYRLPEPGQANFTALGRLESGVNACCISGPRAVISMQTGPNRWSNAYRMHLVGLHDFAAPHLGVAFGDNNEIPVSLQGSTLVSYSRGQVVTYDIDGAKPRRLGSLNIDNIQSVEVHGDVLVVFVYAYNYRGAGTQNLVFVDISQPHDPRKVGEMSSPYAPRTARLGDILWVGSTEGIHILDIANPARAQYIGQQPSASTLAYLKRRGRRLLRVLAEGDEVAYLRLATQVLGRSASEGLDFSKQWIEADLLVGNERVWEQTRHGRGPIVRPAKFWRRQRLERAPGAWDTHLDSARELATRDALPWQTRVTLRRILRANGQSLPLLAPAALEAILWGDWPFAVVEAAREAQERLGELSPRALAALLWSINPRRRAAVLERVTTRGGQGRIAPEVGSHLATLLGRDVATQAPAAGGVSSLTRRAREIALLLAARCDLSDRKFEASGALPAIATLLSAGEAPLRSLGLDFCRRLAPQDTLEVVTILPRVAQSARENFIEALCQSAARGKFNLEILTLRVRHDNTEVRAAVWRLIAASKTTASVTRDLWASLLRGLKFGYNYSTRQSRWVVSSYLQVALDTPAALDVLARSGVPVKSALRFGSIFWGQPPASAGVFTAYSLFHPATTWVAALEQSPDAIWSDWKGLWLRTIARHPAVLGAFWSAVQAELENGKMPEEWKARLRARTFQDAAVASTFVGASGSLPPALLLQLIGTVPNEVWRLWRGPLLERLQTEATTRATFWEAARTLGLGNDLLRARLVDDAEFAATFGLLESDALDFDDPALENLLLQWLEARRDTLDGDDLVRAGVHPLPAARAWGLTQLQARGLSVLLALRLLESDLPDAMRVAAQWFETSEGNPVDLALALCDSPHLATRVYGREFLAGRLETLLAQGLLARLQENPNAEMQSFVAQLLLERPAATIAHDATDGAQAFDRAVLRGRYRARKAKNLVQQRRTEAKPLPDTATLLELARGRTPRDADWAWTQLAKRALEGEIENVEVSGVGGI